VKRSRRCHAVFSATVARVEGRIAVTAVAVVSTVAAAQSNAIVVDGYARGFFTGMTHLVALVSQTRIAGVEIVTQVANLSADG
jgi:hypothetical protein